MKLGYKDFWIDFSMDETYNKAKQILHDIKESLDATRVKDYTIALIDYRYYETGYIIDYGKLHCSIVDITSVDFRSHLTLSDMYCVLTLERLFAGEAKEYLLESTGELNGYEDDTPQLSEFDFVIEL